jgi:hypothetical protein
VLANTYLIVPPDPSESILVDPSVLDVQLLDLVERHGYYVRHLLFTHGTHTRAQGIRTIRRVYDVDMYVPHGGSPPYACTYVREGTELHIGGCTVTVRDPRDEGGEGVLYDIEGYLFTGVWLGAGVVGTDSPHQTRIARKHDVVDRLAGYPDHTPIFPYLGPPTTLGIERQVSPAFTDYSDTAE